MLACHCSSGLGNQMNSYAEFLAYKKANPNHDCYLETINYEIKQDAIAMWNGYELDNAFGIRGPFIKDLFSEKQWQEVINEVQESHFWANGNWDYGPVFVKAFEHQGLNMTNLCQSRGWDAGNDEDIKTKAIRVIKSLLGSNAIVLRNQYWRFRLHNQEEEFGRLPAEGNYLCGGFGKYMYRNSGMRYVEDEVRSAFTFREIEDQKNRMIQSMMHETNSVSIHVRRGDMLGSNADFFKYGYYRKAIKFIKQRIKDPVFFIFCIPGDSEWCKENLSIFNLERSRDRVFFVDWNCGRDSFRDMQLMASCKHNIITRTSFGWWGAYLNLNPNKITVCPDYLFDTTVTLA